MKLKHLLLSALAVASVAVSCKKDNGQDDKPSVSVEPASVTFEVGDMEPRIVKVTSNREWKIEDLKETWLEAEKLSDTDAKISVKEQNAGKDRTATVSFRVAGQKASLTVTQKGEGGGSEPVVDGDGSKEKPYTVAQATAVAQALAADAYTETAVYVKGTVVSLKDPETTISKYGSITLYISDDGKEDGQFYVYGLKDVDGAKFTAADKFAAGDVVVLYGKLQNYKGNTPEMATGGQLVSVNGKKPETPEPTPDPTPSDAIFAESFSASQGDFTIEDKNLPAGAEYIWKFDAQYGMKASAYINNTSLASESWLISPEIDLTSVKEASLSFDHAANKFPAGKKVSDFLSVKVSKDGGSTWADLVIPTWPAGTDWNFIASGSADLAAYVGSKIKVAFVYTSKDGESGTWEVKNFVVEPKAGSSEPAGPDEPVADGTISLTINDIASNFTATTVDDIAGFKGTANGVTITYWNAGGNSAAPVAPSDLLKLYKNNALTIAVDGKKIKKVEFTFTSAQSNKYALALVINSDGGKVVEPKSNVLTWEGTATSEFKCTAEAGQVRIQKIVLVTE